MFALPFIALVCLKFQCQGMKNLKISIPLAIQCSTNLGADIALAGRIFNFAQKLTNIAKKLQKYALFLEEKKNLRPKTSNIAFITGIPAAWIVA